MSFLERSRMRGIPGQNNTFHHPRCRFARPDLDIPKTSAQQFARCCMYDFYADEEANERVRAQGREAIKQLRWAEDKGYLPADVTADAIAEVEEMVRVKTAAGWDVLHPERVR